MEKINVAELLRNCPQGMELDCTMFEGVTFERVYEESDYPIAIRVRETNINRLTKEGCWNKYSNAKCVIFPKGKTTWEGFVPPCKFKDGDIIYTNTAKLIIISIFKEFDNNNCNTYIDYCDKSNKLYTNTSCLCNKENIDEQRLATKEEKAKLFDAIKDNGYKWNPETKTLEKLPKFKVGDRVKHISTCVSGIVVKVTDKEYHIDYPKGEGVCYVSFTLEKDYELASNKFDINTLVPFESRVLVRDKNSEEWRGQFFSHYANGSDRQYVCIGIEGLCEYKKCIPYEGNEHLLGKTDDCNEYFKSWK